MAENAKDLRKRVETLLRGLGEVESARLRKQADFDEEIKEVREKHAPRIDRLTEARDAHMEELHELIATPGNWSELLGDEPGKTIVLRGGTISVRTAAASLEITNESAALKWLRRHGGMRSFTKRAQLTINKVELKKHPDIIAKMTGVVLKQEENLIVKPAKSQLEIKRVLQPLRRRDAFKRTS